mgnify:CR=1 FL=1
MQFCYHDLPEKLDLYDYDAFNRSKTEFYAVCSNVETGKPEYIRITDMKNQIDVIRASASLPYVSRLVKTEGMKLLDGGCTDSIPLRAFAKMGYKKCVVVLTRPAGYRKKPGNFWLPEAAYHKYPAFVRALRSRYYFYNKTVEWIDRLEQEGKIFVIRPSVALPIGRTEHSVEKLQETYDPLKIGRLERSPEKLQQVYDIGRRDALMKMRDLKCWLENH